LAEKNLIVQNIEEKD